MKSTLIKTADGSYTLHVPELKEHYHSVHGALQEANHVFINNGLSLLSNKSTIYVLEMGLGTTLNAYLSYEWAKKNNIEVCYYGIEAYPLDSKIISTCLNQIGLKEDKILSFFSLLSYGESRTLDNFTLTPLKMYWQDVSMKDLFDLIFYDAFGPRAQEEMWTINNFKIAFRALKTGGIFVTYCAKGQVKRDLKSVGFKVESRPGPPGKREMIVAYKS